MRTTILLFWATLVSATGLQAAKVDWPYRDVTLILPRNLDYGTTRHMAFPAKTAELRADEAGRLLINGHADWSTRGLPSQRPCVAVRPDTTKKAPGKVRMILNCDGEALLLFAATADFEVAKSWFQQIFVPGKKSNPALETFLKDWRQRKAAILFPDADEEAWPMERRLALVGLAEQAQAIDLQVINYRDSRYLELDLGLHGEVFNTIQLRQSQHLARVIGQRLLAQARQVEELLGSTPTLGGVALKLEIGFKNFVTGGEAGRDQLELLMPRAELERFVRDEITSQGLLNAGVMRVNGGRVEVDLSQQ